MSFENYLKESTVKHLDLEKKILNLANDIAQESQKNYETLIEQGNTINTLKNTENKIDYQLKNSSLYLRRIGSYAYRITKFFTKDYYYSKPQETISEPVQMSSIPVATSTNVNVNDTDNFELALKKNLKIIKNIQLNISNELDDQIHELNQHNDKILQLDAKVKDLNNTIQFFN
jgi:hypothetical protein